MSDPNAHKPGYKHTPLGWIPDEWEVRRIADVSTVNPSRRNIHDETMVSFLAMADVSEEGLIINETVMRFSDVKNGYTYFEDNDIIIAKITPCFENGKGGLVRNLTNGIGLGSTEFHVVRASEVILPELIFYHTRRHSFRGVGEQNMTGSAGQKRVPTDFIESYKLPLPPLPEQRAIAGVLSTWDRAIEKTQALITQKELRKKWLMQMLLTGKKRLKGFSGEWSWQPIHSLADEVSVKNSTDRKLTVLSCTKHDGLVPSLEYFGRKIFSDDLSTYKIVSKSTFAYATNHIEEGSIGYQKTYEEALISPMYTVFKTNGVNDDFLFRVLKSHNYIHQYQKRMEGSIDRRGGLRWDEFSKIKVPIPPVEEQNVIASVFDMVDKEIQILTNQLNHLKEQKKGLMQKLLTGQIRVKVS